MAQSPEINEAFLREVDENYRRDRAQAFARTYGKWIVAALILFLAAVGGFLYWRNHQAEEARRQTEELKRVYDDIGAGNLRTVPPRIEQLAKADSDAIRASALLTSAAVALEQNDRAKAIAAYRQIQNDGGLPDAYRDLALLRVTAIEFDSLKPEEVISRLQPLAKAGEPYFGSAGELTALAMLKQNKRTEAGRLFAAIAADAQVPETLRSRAAQIAGTLGVDASAALPMPAQ